MAWAHVQSKAATFGASGSSSPVTMDGAVTVGKKLVVFIYQGGATIDNGTCADNLGNTYTEIPACSIGNSSIDRRVEAWYCDVTTGGTPTVTFTHGSASSDRGIAVIEYSGLESGAPEASNAAQGNAANPSVSVTTLTDDALVVSQGYAFASVTSPVGFTERTTGPRVADINKATAGAQAATWQHSSANYTHNIAAFEQTAGGGEPWPPGDTPAAPPLRVARSNLRLG